MLLCLRGTKTPLTVNNTSKIDLCAIVAASNKMNPFYIYSMSLHDHKYVRLHIYLISFFTSYFFFVFTRSFSFSLHTISLYLYFCC